MRHRLPTQTKSGDLVFFLLLVTPIYAFLQSAAHALAAVASLWIDPSRVNSHIGVSISMFSVMLALGFAFAMYNRHAYKDDAE